MRRTAILGLLIVAGCAMAPNQPQPQAQSPANPEAETEHIMRDGARTTMTSKQNSSNAAMCYATAVNNRSERMTANAVRTNVDDYRVVVRDARSGTPIAIVNVTSVGTVASEADTRPSSAELFMRRGTRGGIEGFRKFLAERC